MKNKKILKIAIVIIIILVVFFGIILILNNKKENSTNEINTLNKENSNDEEISEEKNDSLIIDGVEYVDASRNFKDVNKDKFSFFCNQERTKYLTYKKSSEKSQIKTKVIYNFDGRVATVFNIGNRETEIIVSDENFEVDGKKLVTESKTLLFEEDNLKCYIDNYKKGYYMHQYVANIDGVDVSIYTASKTKGDEELKNAVKEIIGDLSVDKKIGFYLDHYISYDGLNGIALKSYKTIGTIDFVDSDQLIMGGYTFWFSPNSTGKQYIPSNLVNCEKIKDRGVGYSISRSKSYGDQLSVYVYNSSDIDGKEVFSHAIQCMWIDDYNESEIKPEDVVKIYLDNIVNY